MPIIFYPNSLLPENGPPTVYCEGVALESLLLKMIEVRVCEAVGCVALERGKISLTDSSGAE